MTQAIPTDAIQYDGTRNAVETAIESSKTDKTSTWEKRTPIKTWVEQIARRKAHRHER